MATQPVAIFVVLATACLVTVLLIPSWTYGARAPQASGASVVTPEVAAARRAGVREEVWESGATSLPLDLCDPGAAARLARTFTLEARRGLPGAFVVRILGSGGAELPEVSLTLDINSSQRSDAKTFQLRPLLVAAGGGNVGVLEIEDASAGTWTATSTVSAVPPAWCDRGGLPGTVQLAALQPWGGVSSAEFSWDGRACAVLIFVWVAVRALATDPAEIPLAFACDAYCLAYSCGLAVRAALEARVKSSFVVQLASAARACALGGDLLLLLGLVLRMSSAGDTEQRESKSGGAFLYQSAEDPELWNNLRRLFACAAVRARASARGVTPLAAWD
ncbi:unnamed protein product [Prorocentrum cordatum]|uniref:Uncharacterized protein n=1 Tax=Prorocentrum cordatum TaxID=2364126 RepID=A0ABN9TEU7_9DINO|nr:unnamed protein product [Polarella glacialis]